MARRCALLSDAPTYAFASHPGGPFEQGTFGETVINLPYIRERWDHLFSLLDVTLQMDNIYQVIVTLAAPRRASVSPT